MKGLNIPVEDFLRSFFNTGETVCLRVFSDRRGSSFKGQKLQIDMGKIKQIIPRLKEYNLKDMGIFFVVNYGGHQDKDIRRINAQFVENDDLPVEEQYNNLMAFPLEPSIIVKTRKSLHGYWLIKDGEVSLFRKVQTKLAEYFDGDKSIVNESRVMRLPNFYHCKKDRVLVQCIKYNPEVRYTQEELLKHLSKGGQPGEKKPSPLRLPNMAQPDEKKPSLPPLQDRGQTNWKKPPPTHPSPHGKKNLPPSQTGLSAVLRRCQFLKHCEMNARDLSEHDWYAMITNLAVFDGGNKIIHELSRPYQGYSHQETEEKICHFLKSGTKPIRCSTIAEKGFKCPKLKRGGCGCRSPAGLAFVPPDADSLLEILKEKPVSRNAIKDVAAAAEFIKEYMYNVDEIIAEPFITSELKSHFELKYDYAKMLVREYRKLIENHKEPKEAEVEPENELPPWYELTERGMRLIPGILANHISSSVNAFYCAEDFYIYENGVYKDVNELEAARMVRGYMIDRYATMGGINDVMGQWKVLIYKEVNQLNSDPFIINLKNGLYNVLDSTLKPHTPDYLSIVQLKASYDEEATCPMFLKFLEDVLEEPERNLLQEILGYLLVPVTKAQKSFVFVGPGNAGKSTLLSVAQDILLGSRYVSNITWQALGDRFKTAELFGKLANIFADLPSKSLEDNGIFKTLTGEDYITAEKKNKNPFSFKNYARFLFSCNEVPSNHGDRTEAFYRRLIIMRFKKSIPESKRDAGLKEKLECETNGIFMWALEGLKRLINNNYIFSETEATRSEVEAYRITNNSVLSFVHDCCVFDSERYVVLGEIYRRYREYCEENGLKAVSKIRMSKELKESFENISPREDKASKRVILQGLYVL